MPPAGSSACGVPGAGLDYIQVSRLVGAPFFPPLGANPKPPRPLPSGPRGDLIGSIMFSRDSDLLYIVSGLGL